MNATLSDVKRRLCVACPKPAVRTMRLQSGRVANLCVPCFRHYDGASVYFVRSGDLVKIGHSLNVTKRLSALQIGSPVPLELWHVVKGQRSLEKELHERFSADRAHGEWFRVSPAITEYVEAT